MPAERHAVSLSQFCELLAIDPARLLSVEYDRRSTSVTLVLEPEHDMQTSGTFPQLNKGGKTIGGKKGKGGRGC